MCVSKKTNILMLIVSLLIEILTLEVVPIKKNVILNTESIIRNVTNDIFIELKLKGVKNNTRIQQHNIVHNYFTKLGLADQHTLVAVNTVSRFDKTKNNKTHALMDILNELLQEDWINEEDNSLTNNINVLKFIRNYLLGGHYNNAENNQEDFNEAIEDLENELAEENMVENSDEDGRSNNETGENEFWSPGFSGRRIYQGIKTKIKTFPFMASIQIFQSFQCGGSIIKSDLILTAASCLQLAYNNRFFRENPAFLSVRVGSDFYQGGGDHIKALEVYFEPSYDPKTLKHNLALIRLQRQINFRKTKKVKRIEIDRKAHTVPYNSGPLIIVGWGAKTSSNILGSPWSNRLSYAEQGLYHYRDCEDIYSKEYVTQTNFCAGSATKGSGACNKDAGDPGVIAGILVGVASFGSPACGTPDVPTVFTKVGYYADWIDEIMEQRVPTRNKFTTTIRPYRPHTPDFAKEFHRFTDFALTPLAGTASPIPIQKVDNVSPHLLRNKKKDQDEELKDLLYNMIDDQKDPGNLRDRIQEMLPKIKKYATTETPTTTEEFLTTDIGSQKHTVIDKVFNEDVDLNIAQIIDKLDGEDVSVQEQPMVDEPAKKKSKLKKGKMKDIPDQHDDMVIDENMLYGENILQTVKGTGVKEAEAFNVAPTDVDIKETEPVRQSKPKKAKKSVKNNKLEPITQDLKKGKLRDKKQEVKLPAIFVKPPKLPQKPVKKRKLPERPDTKHKIPERPDMKYKIPEKNDKKHKIPERNDKKHKTQEIQKPVQPVTKNIKKEKKEKWDVKQEILYTDDNGDIVNDNVVSLQVKLLKDKLKQTATNVNKKPPTVDGDMELDGVIDDVLGTGLEANLGVNQGEVDEDGFIANDDVSIGDSFLGVTNGKSAADGRTGVNNIYSIDDELGGVNDGLNIDAGLGGKVYELAEEIDGSLKEHPPIDKGKVKKHDDRFQKTVSVGKRVKSKVEIIQYDEFDYNPTVKYDQKDKKENTEEVLTLLYLSSEEANKGKKKNKNNNREKNDAEPSFKDLMNFDKENDDDLEVVDEFFKVPIKNEEKKTLYDNLPRDKLYDLLTEAINDMTSKKRNA